MADFQPTDGVVQAIIRMTTWDLQVIENVWNVGIGSDTLDATAADVIATKLQDVYVNIADVTFSGNTYDTVIVNDIRVEDGPGFVADFTPIPGTDGADPLPGQNAALLSWRTSLRGPSYRGRTYIGGLCEDAVTSGVLAAATESDLQLMIDEVLDPWAYDFVVLSRFHNGDARTEAIGTPITAGSFPAHFATQRRRRS